jgi:hypothetical protein
MYDNEICVFCYHNIKSWDSNGTLIYKKDAIRDYSNIVYKWKNIFSKYLKDTNKILSKLPKGTLQIKKIRDNKYYYLAKREGKKIKYIYLGKKTPIILSNSIKLRINITKNIRRLRPVFYTLGISKRPSCKINYIEIFNRDNFTCQYCGKSIKDGVNLQVDHVNPVKFGGKNNINNYKTACSKCNTTKNKRILSK